MGATIWQKCLHSLEGELTAQQFNTWIKPLQAELDTQELRLLAPNKYIRDQVSDMFMGRIQELVDENGAGAVSLQIGSSSGPPRAGYGNARVPDNSFVVRENFYPLLKLNREFTFDTFVAGRSNGWRGPPPSRFPKTSAPPTSVCCCTVVSVWEKLT